ncbi:MAG: LysM peptidoglycan-binding domain-containing protein, partial [Alistipes sp.]|nr:LysM peptidoglycan-binding domain-containing protein [Alistipes sp.]
SYLDHAEFLDSSPRYDSLFSYPSNDYRSWARGLKAAGYATAPDYAERLVAIIEKYNLHLLDQQDGDAIYSSGKNAKENAEYFAIQSNLNRQEAVGIDPFRISSSIHKGYNVYRTNNTCYVVAKKDDTYASLGKTFAISEKMLRRFNDVAKSDTLAENDIVYIERKKDRWLGDALLHEVRENEDLHSLSQTFGIRKKNLARLNHLRTNSKVEKGQTIRIR